MLLSERQSQVAEMVRQQDFIRMEALFSAYKVDIGIYGVAGVDEDGTLLDFYEEEVRARQLYGRIAAAPSLCWIIRNSAVPLM
jgi:DeoR/GlpR family transcriptional regulator of sugar metabolism